ncbi:MAG: acetyl-CoA carboxylase biotin carboxylase subunit [Bacilli bacterium]
MIRKVLVANRGEIAVRIIRACQELNILSVALYSIADKDSLHVTLADEAICIGPASSKESYLNINNILQAAISTNADAIHPGFGFLSENAKFVKACEELNIKFIGPKAHHIDLMGDKIHARQTMAKACVPIIKGYEAVIEDDEQLKEVAKEIGYPIIVKASAGGGGKGMRIAYSEEEITSAYQQALNEAVNAFNDDRMYLEHFVSNPRHIEVQVIADSHGNIAHLFERECSIQRNNQKMIEEAPVENISQATKDKLYQASIKACQAINYLNAGTIEYVMDQNENFYFIEMNTRIQVEHPVTEMITGIDLIKEQINIANGKKLSFKQEELKATGHAIELRINAEDPSNNFTPQPGIVKFIHFPGGNGVRIDSAMFCGSVVSPYYDSMIAKIIVHGKNRDVALDKAIRCLEELDVEGIKTNIEFQLEILLSDEFQDNEYNTSFIKNFMSR